MNPPSHPYPVCLLGDSDLPAAMEMVWQVFQEFEAPDYSPEGVEEFRRFIDLPFLRGQIAEGLRLWGSYDGDRVVGLIAMRPPAHVSLLFVDRDYHRRGIARSMWETAREAYRGHDTVTVNSSPYAKEAYTRLGFSPTGGEQVVNGLRFWPMEYRFEA